MTRHNSRSGLFLMEIMAVILFFSICAAICVSVFAKASSVADKSAELNTAAARSVNIAEIYKSAGGNIKETAHMLGDASGDELTSVKNYEETQNAAAGETQLEKMEAIYKDMTVVLEKKSDGAALISVFDTEYTEYSRYDGYTETQKDESSDEIFTMSVREKEGAL